MFENWSYVIRYWSITLYLPNKGFESILAAYSVVRETLLATSAPLNVKVFTMPSLKLSNILIQSCYGTGVTLQLTPKKKTFLALYFKSLVLLTTSMASVVFFSNKLPSLLHLHRIKLNISELTDKVSQLVRAVLSKWPKSNCSEQSFSVISIRLSRFGTSMLSIICIFFYVWVSEVSKCIFSK